MTVPTRLSREVAQLNRQAVAARATLARLQRQIARAEDRLGGSAALMLRDANEQLVLTALRASEETELVRRALSAASRTAERDPLTRLPNRVLLLDRLTRAITAATRNGTRLALLFVDLDGFKLVSDTLGHVEGDRMLRLVAQRLSASVRAMDTVSRHGGDEFLILLPEVSDASDATAIAAKVHAALAAPARAGQRQIRLSASIGISHFPDDGTDADTLIDRADAEMYRAKRLREARLQLDAAGPDATPSGRAAPPSGAWAAADGVLQHAQLREANEALVFAALTAQAMQASAEKVQARQTDILGLVAHELRNPLAPMLMAAATLTRGRPDARQMRQVQGIIERQVGHIGRLVEDLLDVSRVNTGKLRLDCGMVDFAELVADAVATLRPAIDVRLQRLAVLLRTELPPIYGDRVRLTQVLANLLDNACKYTRIGGALELSVVATADMLVVTVCDDGIGIDASVLPTIFDAFVQDGRAVRFSGAGLGIGLTVVRELVEAHGGDITASSGGIDLGSRFVVTLPLKGPAGPRAA
jgi:diguanylate cyclase (GGDEF)-like protein